MSAPHPLEAGLRQGLQTLALELCDAQVHTLLAYVDWVAKWNKVYNLTAVLDQPSGGQVTLFASALDMTYGFRDTWYLAGGASRSSLADSSLPSEQLFVNDVLDTDGDGLPDDQELLLGTDPSLADSDG
ncbi:MAG: hypothetical protein EOM69_04415, partial [Clostridia bacterium]|nr:hypothetical protein [Clostridia bacterium]